MDLGLKDKRALVLGASQGIGAGIARALAAEGCDLILGARDRGRLEALAGDLHAQYGISADVRNVDFADLAAVEALGEDVAGAGNVDILINNGGGPPPSGALGVETSVWRAQFEAMVLGVIRITGTLVAGMRQRGWGRILTVASSGVVQPIPTLGISNTLRASLVAYMKTLSAEVAPDGVTVNVLAPGRIWTERTDRIDTANAKRLGIEVEEARRQSWALIPMRRYGTVEEFAAVATFLAGEPAGYVTGHVMRVDGGLIRSI